MFENPGSRSNKSVNDPRFNFIEKVERNALDLKPVSVETLQVNVTKLCNQACLHCHVGASPKRTEQMDRRTIDRCLEILSENDSIRNLDITGGAPELNPDFDYFVSEARKLGKHVLVRHNLTVIYDGNPVTGESKSYLPEFFAENNVEIVSSLPYYQEYFTDRQRGKGVFGKSINALLRLNECGYAREDTGLLLDLVYNPVGPFLPASQEDLEEDYKRELREKYGIEFNRLYTITNMPIHRFREQLERSGHFESYMAKLSAAFNPSAAEGVMCRSLLSIGYDGTIYDCDFNQMLELPVLSPSPKSVFDFEYDTMVSRNIVFASHCFGCTAGAGSSCGGATA